MNIKERFWKFVKKENDSKCWLWLGKPDSNGYGRLQVGKKSCKAYRVSYELHREAIPNGMYVDHICHNVDETCKGGKTCKHRLCVNPNHLELTSKRGNTLSGKSFSARFARRTKCNYGHPFDTHNTVINKSGYRSCKTCRRLQSEKQRRKKGIPKRTEVILSRKQTHCKKGHEFTPENTRIYKGSQHCKECSRSRCREFMRKKRSR